MTLADAFRAYDQSPATQIVISSTRAILSTPEAMQLIQNPAVTDVESQPAFPIDPNYVVSQQQAASYVSQLASFLRAPAQFPYSGQASADAVISQLNQLMSSPAFLTSSAHLASILSNPAFTGVFQQQLTSLVQTGFLPLAALTINTPNAAYESHLLLLSINPGQIITGALAVLGSAVAVGCAFVPDCPLAVGVAGAATGIVGGGITIYGGFAQMETYRCDPQPHQPAVRAV